MQDRIDALGDSVQYLDRMTGSVLSLDSDPILQELVAQAAALLKTPIALVSLVLRRTQLFRATFGLPPELETSKATDRATSFCQLVVRDETPLLVSHASADERIPQDLVKRFGLESYVGVPIRLGETVVGSMCGLDVVQRSFSAEDVEKLGWIAEQASARLTQLASEQRPSYEMVGRAANPAMADMRNALVVLTSAPGFVTCAVAELETLAALTNADLNDEDRLRGIGALQDASLALNDLRDVAKELTTASERVYNGIQGMESLLALRPDTEISSCFASAGRLADHHTKLVGGVEWPPITSSHRVLAPSTIVVAAMTTLLSELSLGSTEPNVGPIRVSLCGESDVIGFRFEVVNGTAATALEAVTNVADLLSGEFGLSLTAEGPSVLLHLALAP